MQIQHQETQRGGEFFIERDGRHIAEITYQYQNEATIVADHTWVDNSLRGQGVARQLLDALVAFAREKQLKIVPTCSYVDVMFQREAEFADVVA
ncbi:MULTISPECIES: GNAT family N-acetyltransferase [Acinetobacter]|jgi:predicted GNAT family acetyltransferase|uniref:GNAT family N-acetyltransferase n=1 Tax=Acinetobacter TaxID=469 RepID=UPI0014443A83|nr:MULTISPECIES: GNAT family N-acetyltransferase [Acinetobacter]MDM1487202.1 N-acetyltransferase [Acinetobacter towneri]NLN56597.1 N-acetyltransferase [Gammaproteobacteria bacterium]